MRWSRFPFSAVVGSDDLALALILTTVSPEVGGVLVRGEKGTAKSTMVRALAAVLPPIEVVAGCRFCCDPAEPGPAVPGRPALQPRSARPGRRGWSSCRSARPRTGCSARWTWSGRWEPGRSSYEPGLLGRAHRGILYVDEVNLLHDHLVDLLLDAAAMGRSTVERDGVSVEHAARFVLVGTMNPEEGELRPQLLDRFGLTVEVAAPRDPAAARRGGPPPDGLRRRPGRLRWPAYAEPEQSSPTADRRRPASCSARSARRRRTAHDRRGLRRVRGGRHARRHRHRPRRGRPRRLARPDRRRRGATSGPPPGWPCRTVAAATRSTRPASTRTCSTRLLGDDEPEPEPPNPSPTAIRRQGPAPDDDDQADAGRAARSDEPTRASRDARASTSPPTSADAPGGLGETVAPAGEAYRTRLFTVARASARGEAGRRSRAITAVGRTVGARPAGPTAARCT